MCGVFEYFALLKGKGSKGIGKESANNLDLCIHYNTYTLTSAIYNNSSLPAAVACLVAWRLHLIAK